MSGVDIDELKKISDGINEVFTNKKNNDVINSELPEAVVPEIGHTSIVKKKVGFKVPPTQFQEQSSDFMTIGCVKLPTQTIYLTLIFPKSKLSASLMETRLRLKEKLRLDILV